jgi:GGDEF domain-containing protein
MDRVATLAEAHEVGSVVVGVAGRDGDPQISDFMDFVESALRMEDAIFRMTRERSVLFLSDVERTRAEDVVDRLLQSFAEQTASPKPPAVTLGYAVVRPGGDVPLLRDVLLDAFPAAR